MPRKGGRKTLTAGPGRTAYEAAGVGFTVESAAAAASVDVTDALLNTNFGTPATGDAVNQVEFADDFKLSRVPIAVAGDEAALTIGIAAVVRDDTNDKFVVHFTATAAASKKVGVRVTKL